MLYNLRYVYIDNQKKSNIIIKTEKDEKQILELCDAILSLIYAKGLQRYFNQEMIFQCLQTVLRKCCGVRIKKFYRKCKVQDTIYPEQSTDFSMEWIRKCFKNKRNIKRAVQIIEYYERREEVIGKIEQFIFQIFDLIMRRIYR